MNAFIHVCNCICCIHATYAAIWTVCMSVHVHKRTYSHVDSHMQGWSCGCVSGMHVTLHYCMCVYEYMTACVSVCVLVAVLSLLAVSQGALINILQAFGVLDA